MAFLYIVHGSIKIKKKIKSKEREREGGLGRGERISSGPAVGGRFHSSCRSDLNGNL